MRGYVDERVTARRCAVFECDLCHRRADDPKTERFGADDGSENCGSLQWWSETANGSGAGGYHDSRKDLCYECAQALADAMQNKRDELLALIGRSEA